MTSEEPGLSILLKLTYMTAQKTFSNDQGYYVGKINYVIATSILKGLLKVRNFCNYQNKKIVPLFSDFKKLSEKNGTYSKVCQKKKEKYEALQAELKMMRK